MVQIIPAILATSEEQYQKDLERISGVDSFKDGWVHIDLTDNKFVQNLTIGPDILKKYPTPLNIEAHLMVETPDTWVLELHKVGVKRIIAHIEAEDSLEDFISQCKRLDIEVGLAIKMDTSLDKLDPYWDILDLVLVMTIEPGFQGQPLLPGALERIKEVKEKNLGINKPFLIGVDGHINDQDVSSVVAAGADHLVVGSFLLEGDIEENVEKIWESLKA